MPTPTVTIGTATVGITDATVTLRAFLDSDGSQKGLVKPPVGNNPNSPFTEIIVALAVGDNTLTVPSNAAGVVVELAESTTAVVKIKGAAGDTGVSLRPGRWSMVSFDNAPPASIILNSSVVLSGCRLRYF